MSRTPSGSATCASFAAVSLLVISSVATSEFFLWILRFILSIAHCVLTKDLSVGGV
jgi:hypothetical protein